MKDEDILNAYLSAIEGANKGETVYIENQFLVSYSSTWIDMFNRFYPKIENASLKDAMLALDEKMRGTVYTRGLVDGPIASSSLKFVESIYNAVVRGVRVYAVGPLWPSGQGSEFEQARDTIQEFEGVSLLRSVKTIARSGVARAAVYMFLHELTVLHLKCAAKISVATGNGGEFHWFTLRSADSPARELEINGIRRREILTEQVYVHSKLLITAGAIVIGSANGNVRSLHAPSMLVKGEMNGKGHWIQSDSIVGDSELLITIRSSRIASAFSRRLLCEHSGIQDAGSPEAGMLRSGESNVNAWSNLQPHMLPASDGSPCLMIPELSSTIERIRMTREWEDRPELYGCWASSEAVKKFTKETRGRAMLKDKYPWLSYMIRNGEKVHELMMMRPISLPWMPDVYVAWLTTPLAFMM